MDKADVAAVLEEIATLLEIQGENPFRCLAYTKGARAVEQLEGNLGDLVRAGKLVGVPGIGETLREKIETLVTTGKLPFHDDLKAKTPPGLLQMLRLPGVGPKKVKLLHDELGLSDLDALKAACEAGAVAKLKGFGAKTQEKILHGIAFLGQTADRVRLDQALRLAEQVADALRTLPGLRRLETCGSVRRRKELCKDVDLLATCDDPAALMNAFVALPMVHSVIGHGETKSSVVLSAVDEDRRRYFLNCDLRVVRDDQFPFALNYFTGSKEHNVAMRQRAIQRGLKLNEYELAAPDGSRSVAASDEADVYRALDLAYVPPELRENTGEIAAAEKQALPDLFELTDLVGTFHCHTQWSDGSATLAEMAQAAKKRGLKYLGIADHSQSLTVANGLSPERVRKQQAEIDELNQSLRGITLFKGIECDILPDGSLDYDDDLLDTFDYVVASVHSHFNQTEAEMTARIVRAMRHPRTTMLGHATGRLLLRREGYKVDLEAVLQTAAETGVLVEINANPHRADLDWIHCKRAKALGVTLVVNPDAHAPDEIDLLRYGVFVGRRGWLEKKDVFNTRSLADVRKWLARRRER